MGRPKINNKCQCSDMGCGVCRGMCKYAADYPLFRVDMDDETGTLFCERCGEDAFESGLFRSEK